MKKPVLLPTNDLSHITKDNVGGRLNYHHKGDHVEYADRGRTAQHLYVVDNKTTHIGDWVIKDGSLFQATIQDADDINQVISCASNEKLSLPLINKEFIELYVEKQGKIDEVDVSIIEFSPIDNDAPYCIVTPKESDDVKVAGDGGIAEQLAQKKYSDTIANASTPEVAKGFMQQRMGYYKGVIDGIQWQKERSIYSEKEMQLMAKTIEALTKQVKESYSREEVEELLSKYGMWRVSNPRTQIDTFFTQNLKK